MHWKRSAAEIEALSATSWACFAFLSAKWYPEEQPEGISFQYRKQAASEWVDVDPSAVVANASDKTYTAEVWGLDPSTTYVFRAVSAKDTETKEKTFTTESAGIVPNMGFDAWYKSGSIWYPNSDSGNFWWDTANGGSDAVGVYPTNPEYSHKIGGDAAAKLEDGTAVVIKGKVSEIKEAWTDQYKNNSVYITDGTNTFYVFRTNVKLDLNDEVVIVGEFHLLSPAFAAASAQAEHRALPYFFFLHAAT